MVEPGVRDPGTVGDAELSQLQAVGRDTLEARVWEGYDCGREV